MPSSRSLALAVLAGGVAVLAGVTALRDTHAPLATAPTPVPAIMADHGHGSGSAAPMGESHDRPALSADEERFALALWKVHTTVRTEAVRMSFTGMAYKTGEIPKETVRDRIAPLVGIFGTAIADVQSLATPASMAATRGTYLEALHAYRDAAVEMIRVADDGKDEHLFNAHDKSSRASTQLLEVSEVLWPGEYKPN